MQACAAEQHNKRADLEDICWCNRDLLLSLVQGGGVDGGMRLHLPMQHWHLIA